MIIKPKDFQEATADRILEVFKSGQNHVLLADEVGLGKTIIAASVIEKVSEWHKTDENIMDDHFKVIYVCSNINIANQNSKKLGIDEQDCLKVSESRLSMQHLKIYQAAGKGHNYKQLIPLTPSTSFSMTGGCGNQYERALMYVLLKRLTVFNNNKKLSDFLHCYRLHNWQGVVEQYQSLCDLCDSNGSNYYLEMSAALSNELTPELISGINEICNATGISLTRKTTSDDNSVFKRQKEIINELRRIFARISLNKLEPDLVVMDEFQRFRDLIAPSDDEAGMLARKFLDNNNTKVLLLSATPYKPFSTLEEISQGDGQDHYREFMQLMNFLLYDTDKNKAFRDVWNGYSYTLSEFDATNFTVLAAQKNKAEKALYQSICRTERFNSGVIDDSAADAVSVSQGDIQSYVEVQNLFSKVGDIGNIPVEYVKSSPYLLSFMDKYVQKQKIERWFKKNKRYDAISNQKTLLLKKQQINTYKKIPSNNARLDKLMEAVFAGSNSGIEKMLWLPANRPYYKTKGVYGRSQNASKLLLFSSWEMVPRMVAAMISYESERIIVDELNKTTFKLFPQRYFGANSDFFDSDENSIKENKKRTRSARLKDDAAKVVVYPCQTLSKLYDKTMCLDKNLSDIIREIKPKVKALIDEKRRKYNIPFGRASAREYYFLMRLLDGHSSELPSVIPKNAEDLLTNISIASPAVCLFRIFENAVYSKNLASCFVSIFNKSETYDIMDLVYGKNDDFYYENVIKYCADGNLQAVLDEWAYVLNETGEALLNSMKNAFIRTSPVAVDTFESFSGKIEKPRMRSHFAVGYFNSKTDDKTAQRTESIRNSFNSPFRPFVLATTSIGQEGLDFHLYCRKIMHWNLPSNPIDLEQREGRINRYQCLALRQSIVKKYGNNIVGNDVWKDMFGKAIEKEKREYSDLVPFWCLPDSTENVKIERIVPMYPISKDQYIYERIIKIIGLYRLTLGQPRQEELIQVLLKEDLPGKELEKLFINLSPYDKKREFSC